MSDDELPKLKALQFCIGAVAKKDLEASYCHFEIKGGRAIAYGGHLAMSTPVACPFDVRPHAKSLVKAVEACGENDISLNMTPAGKLTVKAGKFRSHVNCLKRDVEFQSIEPQGDYFEVSPEFLASLVTLAPFMSIDASRPWAQGLKIGQMSTFVTNNIILAQKWHGANFPREVIVPSDAIHELIRIRDTPRGIQFNNNSLTFFFDDKRWLWTHLIATDGGWGNADKIFDANTNEEGLELIDEEIYEAIDILKPFLDDRGLVYFKGDRLATSPTDEEGASLDHPVADGPIFHAAQLRSLQKIATKINLSTWPKPCYFTGEKLRGVIVGVRQ